MAVSAKSLAWHVLGRSWLGGELAVQGNAEIARPHLDGVYLDPPLIVSGCQCAIGAHGGRVRAGTPSTGEQLELGIVGVAAADGAAPSSAAGETGSRPTTEVPGGRDKGSRSP